MNPPHVLRPPIHLKLPETGEIVTLAIITDAQEIFDPVNCEWESCLACKGYRESGTEGDGDVFGGTADRQGCIAQVYLTKGFITESAGAEAAIGDLHLSIAADKPKILASITRDPEDLRQLRKFAGYYPGVVHFLVFEGTADGGIVGAIPPTGYAVERAKKVSRRFGRASGSPTRRGHSDGEGILWDDVVASDGDGEAEMEMKGGKKRGQGRARRRQPLWHWGGMRWLA